MPIPIITAGLESTVHVNIVYSISSHQNGSSAGTRQNSSHVNSDIRTGIISDPEPTLMCAMKEWGSSIKFLKSSIISIQRQPFIIPYVAIESFRREDRQIPPVVFFSVFREFTLIIYLVPAKFSSQLLLPQATPLSSQHNYIDVGVRSSQSGSLIH